MTPPQIQIHTNLYKTPSQKAPNGIKALVGTIHLPRPITVLAIPLNQGLAEIVIRHTGGDSLTYIPERLGFVTNDGGSGWGPYAPYESWLEGEPSAAARYEEELRKRGSWLDVADTLGIDPSVILRREQGIQLIPREAWLALEAIPCSKRLGC